MYLMLDSLRLRGPEQLGLLARRPFAQVCESSAGRGLASGLGGRHMEQQKRLAGRCWGYPKHPAYRFSGRWEVRRFSPMSSCAGGGWIFRTSNTLCSTSRASETTSSQRPRPRPRPPSPAVRTRSLSLWTPGTWACSSDPGPRIYGPAFGTGSLLTPAILQPPDTSIRRHSV